MFVGDQPFTRQVQLIGIKPEERARTGDFAEFLQDEQGQRIPPSFEVTDDLRMRSPAGEVLKSIDPDDPFADVLRHDMEEQVPDQGAILGFALATLHRDGVDQFLAPRGSKVILTFPTAGKQPQPANDDFTVTGFFKSGMSEYDSLHVYVPLEQLQRIRGMGDKVNQIQVKARSGLTFARALRSILRADPDDVLIGEIRDAETAQIAVEAALTGHLVLTTLHTNDAPSAVNRLVEMGVEPILVASAMDSVVAQRLCRRLCAKCKQAYTPTEQELRDVGFPREPGEPLPTLHRPIGCATCSRTGYRGRMALHEVMPITEEIQRLTVARSSTDEVARAAHTAGMVPLRRDGWRFQPATNEPFQLLCRGQVIPSSKELVYELFIEEVHDGPTPRLYADLLCTVDGLKAFHARRMGLELVLLTGRPIGTIHAAVVRIYRSLGVGNRTELVATVKRARAGYVASLRTPTLKSQTVPKNGILRSRSDAWAGVRAPRCPSASAAAGASSVGT